MKLCITKRYFRSFEGDLIYVTNFVDVIGRSKECLVKIGSKHEVYTNTFLTELLRTIRHWTYHPHIC